MADDGLLGVLPEIFQLVAGPGTPLSAVVAVSDDLHAPVRGILDRVETIVDAGRAPVALVPYLSTWVDLGWLTLPATDYAVGPVTGVATAQQRDLIANAAELSARRGTIAGVCRFLQLATGVGGFDVVASNRAFHMQVIVPTAAADQTDLVARIVSGIKPAHMTHEVVAAAPAAATAPAVPAA